MGNAELLGTIRCILVVLTFIPVVLGQSSDATNTTGK